MIEFFSCFIIIKRNFKITFESFFWTLGNDGHLNSKDILRQLVNYKLQVRDELRKIAPASRNKVTDLEKVSLTAFQS